jgi:hypothetical protein
MMKIAKQKNGHQETIIMNQSETGRFLYEIFDASLPRLAPGSADSTVKALNMLLPSVNAPFTGTATRAEPLSIRADLKHGSLEPGF